MRSAALLVLLGGMALAACGGDEKAQPKETRLDGSPGPSRTLVAALGDSITAGSPLWDPDAGVREQIGAADERSQYEHWAERIAPRLRFRNCGVYGERTDEIARRFDGCARGAKALVLQGGINDIAQGRDVEGAARNLAAMADRGRRLGLVVVLVEVLPWNNGYPLAAPRIARLNELIRATGRKRRLPVLRWYRALEDPAARGRMRAGLTDDGDHPSPSGYRVLGELAAKALQP